MTSKRKFSGVFDGWSWLYDGDTFNISHKSYQSCYDTTFHCKWDNGKIVLNKKHGLGKVDPTSAAAGGCTDQLMKQMEQFLNKEILQDASDRNER